MINDVLANTNPAAAAGEQCTPLRTTNYGEVLRGASFTPGTAACAREYFGSFERLAAQSPDTDLYWTVAITNNGSSAVNGPYYVAFQNLPAGVTLTDRHDR